MEILHIDVIKNRDNLFNCIPEKRYHIGSASANGTFGELLQGVLPNSKEHFLVTLPIDSCSHSLFVPDTKSTEIKVFPSHKKKSLLLAQAILKNFNIETGGKLLIESELLEGKGLASSSADLVATAKAVLSAINKNIHISDLLQFLKQIEPSDGVMYSNCVAFYHRKVTLLNKLGILPCATIIGIDEGGIVDTIEYNKLGHSFSDSELNMYATLLEEITSAFQENDLYRIGHIATQSAIMNQKYNPKIYLDHFINISKKHHCAGVVVAHSGTCVGILLDESDKSFLEKKHLVIQEITILNKNILIFKSKSNISEVNDNYQIGIDYD